MEETFTELSLEKFCNLFKIAKENCTCLNPGVRNGLRRYCLTTQTPRVIFVLTDDTIIYATVVIIASFLALFGNSLVLLIAWKNRLNYSICQKVITVLAGSDICFAILQFIDCIPRLWTDKWIYGNFACKFFRSGSNLSALIAIGFIMIISIERFIGVVKPMRNSHNLILVLCHVNFVFGVFTVIPLLINIKIDEYNYCLPVWSSKRSRVIYDAYVLSATCMLPVLLVACLYAVVIYKLRTGQDSKFLQRSMNAELYLRRAKRSRRIIRIVFGLIIAFIVLVIPSRVITLYLDFYTVSNETYKVLSLIILVTYPFHVAINPVIYSAIDDRWRSEVRRCFQSKRQRRYSSSRYSSSYRKTSVPCVSYRKKMSRCESNDISVNRCEVNETYRTDEFYS